MQKHLFHEGWTCRILNSSTAPAPVSLPHDAMRFEPRSAHSLGKHNTGWFQGFDYEYVKVFAAEPEWKDRSLLLEFEGVYHNAEVYLNGKKLAERPYGYSNFFADLTGKLEYDQPNILRVIAHNSDQPNSRWYSGSGIYRPVQLWQGPAKHILYNGIRIRTVRTEVPTISLALRTTDSGTAVIEILEDGQPIHSQSVQTDGCITTEIVLPNAVLWSPETPKLYTCRVTFGDDVGEEQFGIRSLAWDASHGLTINDKRVILRGACIHHDNGVLGAICDPQAEERKVRILMENGYNAIRSAHNPCSKALLDACDRLGMLVMDEFVDCWYIHKTKHDYVDFFEDWWQRDLSDMVDKDYNHPSVIMYSTGNEVSETAQERGIALTGEMTQFLHQLDASRPVPCGINIFFNFLSSIGFGVYSDEKAESAAKEETKNSPVGSEFYNTMAAMLGDKTMKIGATLPPCDWKTKGAFANMDIAGYNYGIYRYKHDLKKYPNRLILGSETFVKDAYQFWEFAKTHPRIIGDFVWAGMDYIGETGVGRLDYNRYPEPPASSDPGWLTSGGGRITLLGTPTAESYYTRVALEQEAGPYLAVRPVKPIRKPPIGAWGLTDGLMSWSWHGCSGNPAEVWVYARAYTVELRLNNRSVGKKRMKKDCRVRFRIPYEDGTLTAISYDKNGVVIASRTLRTASEETQLTIVPEEHCAEPGRLCHFHLRYTDADGIVKPLEQHTLTVSVSGGELLGVGSASSYNPHGFWSGTIDTFWGEAMALVRADGNETIRLTVTDEQNTWQYTLDTLSEPTGTDSK